MSSRRHGVASSADAAGNKTEGRDAAGIDDAFDPGGERRKHQLARAVDIGAEHRRRIGHPKPVIGGDVKQIPAPGDGGVERRRVLERALGDVDVQAGEVAAVAFGRARTRTRWPSAAMPGPPPARRTRSPRSPDINPMGAASPMCRRRS